MFSNVSAGTSNKTVVDIAKPSLMYFDKIGNSFTFGSKKTNNFPNLYIVGKFQGICKFMY